MGAGLDAAVLVYYKQVLMLISVEVHGREHGAYNPPRNLLPYHTLP